jgi:ATP-dependent DNA helicase RecG
MAGNAVTDTSLVGVARQALPFRLTGAQDRALAEILDDMAYPAPMARLLQVRHVWRHDEGRQRRYMRRLLT